MNKQFYFFNIGIFFIIFYISSTLLFPLVFSLENLFGIEILDRIKNSMYYINQINVATSTSILYSSMGLISFSLGYFYFIKDSKKFEIKDNFVSSFFLKNWSFENIYITFWLLLLFVLFYKSYGILTLRYDVYYFYFSIIGNEKIAYFFSFNILNYILLFIVSFGYFKSRAEKNIIWEKKFKILFYSLFIIMLLFSFNLKSRYLTIQIIFIVIMTYNIYNTINYKRTIFGILVFITLIMSLKPLINEFRSNNEGTITLNMETSISRFISRVNQSSILAQLFRYEHSYDIDASELAKNINIIDYNNRSGVGMTMIGYFFYDYGLIGILIGLFVVGIIYRLLFYFFERKFNLFIMLYVLIFPFLLNVFEQDFLQLIKKILFYFVLCLTIHVIIMKGGIIDQFKNFYITK